MKLSDDLLKKIASDYVEQYGEQLHRERETLDEGEQLASPGFDARMQREHKARKRRGSLRIWAVAAAACLALLLVLPSAIRIMSQPGGSQTAHEYAEPLPISFAMSKNFTISHMEQDREQTIYYIDNALQDDVVLVMQPEEGAPEFAYDELHELEINGTPALGRYRADYSILTFNHDGIRYTLTCRHDFSTLAQLGEDILA